MAEFNFNNLLTRTFGYIAPPYRLGNQQVDVSYSETYGIAEPVEFVGEYSSLGTAYLAPCTIGGLRLANEPVITIVGQRKIIATDFDGNVGTFKEEYSLDDYRITIKGIITNEDLEQNIYPADVVRELENLCKSPGHKEIVNKICELHGIHHIAIERWEFPGVPGEPEMQAYIIEALSDNPYEFDLIINT